MFNELIYIKNFKQNSNGFLKNQEDILEKLNSIKTTFRNEQHSENYFACLYALIDKTIADINNAALPSLTGEVNENFRYVIKITAMNLVISIQRLTQVGGEDSDLYSINEGVGQLVEYVPLFDISEYARNNNYYEENVRQWIRRGRMSSAKKINGKWIIPALSELVKLHHKPEKTEYFWTSYLPVVYKDFGFMNDFTNVVLYHSRNKKDQYYYKFFNHYTSDSKEIVLTKKESVNFELFMRGNQLITSNEEVIIIIDRK